MEAGLCERKDKKERMDMDMDMDMEDKKKIFFTGCLLGGLLFVSQLKERERVRKEGRKEGG